MVFPPGGCGPGGGSRCTEKRRGAGWVFNRGSSRQAGRFRSRREYDHFRYCGLRLGRERGHDRSSGRGGSSRYGRYLRGFSTKRPTVGRDWQRLALQQRWPDASRERPHCERASRGLHWRPIHGHFRRSKDCRLNRPSAESPHPSPWSHPRRRYCSRFRRGLGVLFGNGDWFRR